MRKVIFMLLMAMAMACMPFIAIARGVGDSMVRTITMDNGLPSNGVRSIVQDKQGYIWFGTDKGLCRYDGYHVQTYYNPYMKYDQYVSAILALDDGILVGTSKGAYLFSTVTERFSLLDKRMVAWVSDIQMDDDHNVWIASLGKEIFRYNLTTHDFKNYSISSSKGIAKCILVDANNQVWALCDYLRGSLVRLNKATDSFEPFPLKDKSVNLSGMAMLGCPDGSVLVGSWDDGLVQVNSDGSTQLLIGNSLSNGVHHIHKLVYDSNQHVLVGSDDGLLEYDVKSHSCRMLMSRDHALGKMSERFVYGLVTDKEDGLWAGTFYGGVYYIPSENFLGRFTAYPASKEGLQGKVVEKFAEDAKHHIWIASDDAGLECYDPVSDSFLNFPGKSQMSTCNVHALWTEGNSLWIGTYSNGVFRMDITSGSCQNFQIDGQKEASSCYALFRDSQHRLWATSMVGVNVLSEDMQVFKPLKSFQSLTVDIKEDRNGNVWFATQNNGLWCYRKNNTWRHYKHVEGDASSIESDVLNSLCLDSKGRLLIASDRGVCQYVSSSDSFKHMDIDIPSMEVACIVMNQGAMWLSTNSGIVKYVPNEPIQTFNRNDGLTCDQFLAGSGLLASDGRIYLGTALGFNAFYPYQVKINHVAPTVAITSFQLFNKQLEVGSDELSEALGHAKQVDLSYDENMFSISFAALSYVSPEKNVYMYKMEGFDKDWITTHEPRATYTNLPAGTYTFRVKATNNDGVWSKEEAKLTIEVHPPFWWSLPAKVFYLLLVGGLIWLYTQSRLKREKVRHQHDMDLLEEKKEQEMREARLQFFTMIAHEIRTPVTLIIGPLETLMEQWKKMGRMIVTNESLGQSLDVINRNAQRLLLLVNQLLDFNKVQEKGLQVHFKLQNISRLMAAVVERFEPAMNQNGIRLEVDYPSDDFAAIIDNEAITKVVSNLMTNALKYTKDFVKLSCQILPDKKNFSLVVEDNGVGISPEEQEKIFSAFYQARDNKPGTGIGLNIVKNLVEAHHGMVEVKSKVGVGSRFIVTLPVDQPDAVVEKSDDEGIEQTLDQEKLEMEMVVMDDSESSDNTAAVEQGRLPGMLIVDDDEDMRNFVKSHFVKDFTVFTAENGKEALQVLREHIVSVVISDWMMPEMDGPEFCRSVRQNQDISHLPFIMLTAKTDNDSKTEGMNCGADMYIEKPFSMKYLEASVRNLLEMRRLLRAKFSHSPLEPIDKIAPTQVDNEFLQKLTKVIEDNIDNSDLNVVFLASQMGMSRSSLFNKIRGLVDVTPNEIIQLTRLKKAAQLLKEGGYRVNEVCYMVGFSSPSYFSKCFQKQFGMKPTTFVESK